MNAHVIQYYKNTINDQIYLKFQIRRRIIRDILIDQKLIFDDVSKKRQCLHSTQIVKGTNLRKFQLDITSTTLKMACSSFLLIISS